jgi:hypothetical protein
LAALEDEPTTKSRDEATRRLRDRENGKTRWENKHKKEP